MKINTIVVFKIFTENGEKPLKQIVFILVVVFPLNICVSTHLKIPVDLKSSDIPKNKGFVREDVIHDKLNNFAGLLNSYRNYFSFNV